MIDYTRRSLDGLWVGDCIGNLGQLYFAHDILKALEAGMAKFGGQLNQFQNQFMYSDDTEEAIVLHNHFHKRRWALDRIDTDNPLINQDQLAKEFAERYYTRDPDGEIYGYGLTTRKVLKDIFDGVPWYQANKTFIVREGMHSAVDKLVMGLSNGQGFKETMKDVNKTLEKKPAEKQGSCGNGSAMRVAPLGAFLARLYPSYNQQGLDELLEYERKVIVEAALQAETTHCHPEGIAGSIAITTLAYDIAEAVTNKQIGYPDLAKTLYTNLLRRVPTGQVKDGIVRAQGLPFNTPLAKVIEVLGNGSHVTCQDTVPICCWLTIKGLIARPIETMYEDTIIETSKCFGDVDTNCAIVGGMIGIACPPPEKWVKFCKPMDGVWGEEIDLKFSLQNMVEDIWFPIRG